MGITPQDLQEWMRQQAMAGGGAPPPIPLRLRTPQEAPDMSSMGPAPTTVQSNGLLDRIAGALFPQPEGLIDPEMARQAGRQGLMGLGLGLLEQSGPSTERRSFGQALARAHAGVAPGVGQMAALMTQGKQAKEREAKRQQILARYSAPPGAQESAVETGERLLRMLPEFARIGDMEMVGKLTELLKSMGLGDQARTRGGVIVNDAGRQTLVDPTTGRTIRQFEADPMRGAGGDFTKSNQMYGRYLNQTKRQAEAADMYVRVLGAANDPTPAGDLSLIFAYMKMLDPGSVVREGEFAQAANTGAIPERVWAQYNRVISGERLTPAQRADFFRQAANLARSVRAQTHQVGKQYSERATRLGLDPMDVWYDYWEGIDIPDENDPRVRAPRPGLREGQTQTPPVGPATPGAITQPPWRP